MPTTNGPAPGERFFPRIRISAAAHMERIIRRQGTGREECAADTSDEAAEVLANGWEIFSLVEGDFGVND
jgi:hypothetical protein